MIIKARTFHSLRWAFGKMVKSKLTLVKSRRNTEGCRVLCRTLEEGLYLQGKIIDY